MALTLFFNIHSVQVNETFSWVAAGIQRVVDEGRWEDDLTGCDPTGNQHSQTRDALLRTLQVGSKRIQ